MVRTSAIPTALYLAPLALFLMAPPAGVAAGNRNFSGSYTLVGSRGAFKGRGGAWTLDIVQTESTIEISKTVDRRKFTNKFLLSGAEGDYTTTSGQVGTGKAQFRGKTLVIDGYVTNVESTSPEMQIHTHEKWDLSSDSKTLSVNVHIDFPKSKLEGYDAIEPWTEIYVRN
jgi:hypothetical protein